MKLAIVYDRINKFGGAERVLLALHSIWPQAPIYTSVCDKDRAFWAKKIIIVPSFLHKFKIFNRRHELLPWLMPIVFESFDFSRYDLVISVTSEAAKGIITKPETLHLCYCLTPTRYLWSGYQDYFPNQINNKIFLTVLNYLKNWDLVAAQRPDKYLAISKTVQARIKKYYNSDSEVIYPPVDLVKFKIQSTGSETNSKFQIPNSKFFLVVSRLVRYKKVDIVVKAFNQLGWSLIIIGSGSEEKRLKNIARPNIKFLGQLTDEELIGYYQNCQAVIFPTEEDFGIVPLEAQASGKPVVAYRGGGATETIIEGKTGEFFNQQTSVSLIDTLKKFKPEKYKAGDCRKQAEKFNQERFKEEFKERVESLLTDNY